MRLRIRALCFIGLCVVVGASSRRTVSLPRRTAQRSVPTICPASKPRSRRAASKLPTTGGEPP